MGLAEAVTEGELLSRGLSDGLADPEHGTAHLKKAFNWCPFGQHHKILKLPLCRKKA